MTERDPGREDWWLSPSDRWSGTLENLFSVDQSVDVMTHQLASLEKGLRKLLHCVPDGLQQAFRLYTVGCEELFGRATEAKEFCDSRELFSSSSCGTKPSIPGQFGFHVGALEASFSQGDSFRCDSGIGEDAVGIDELFGDHAHLFTTSAAGRGPTIDRERQTGERDDLAFAGLRIDGGVLEDVRAVEDFTDRGAAGFSIGHPKQGIRCHSFPLKLESRSPVHRQLAAEVEYFRVLGAP